METIATIGEKTPSELPRRFHLQTVGMVCRRLTPLMQQ